MFIFNIDLTLTVAMVTENGRQYRLRYSLVLYVNLSVKPDIFFSNLAYFGFQFK